MYSIDSGPFSEIDAGTFSAASWDLGTLSNALNSVRAILAQARRFKDPEKKKQELAKAAKYANTLMKAIAQKWRERGDAELYRKIYETRQKVESDSRTVNPYDAVLLEFLEAERKKPNQPLQPARFARG